ncbi:MAG: AraC family transcriptional regulator [Pseudomonadales bacterium]|nr:AraC family transcriptional regulator [Pseudomonadales bacterium]
MNNAPQITKAYILIGINLNIASAKDLLEHTSLSVASLEDTDTLDISIAQQMVHNIKKCCDNPNWPAVLGAHLGAACHGAVGYATLSAPTTGKALMTFLEWGKLRCDSYSRKIIQQDNYVEIIISDTTGDPFLQEVFFEVSMRALEVLIELIICRASKGDTELHFKTHAINRRKLMEDAYDSRLFFGSDANKLIIPNSIWYQPSPLYDKDTYEFNLRKCQQLLDEQGLQSRIDLRVMHIIREHFEQTIMSPTIPFPPPTLTQICGSIHITERTLIRKLKDCNTSYKMILERERKDFAERLLNEARYTIHDIADILGYKESGNFCRAFKRWRGKSPADYRRNPEVQL